MVRRRHPKKDMQYVLEYASDHEFSIREIHKSHRWGEIRCPVCGDYWPIPSTPRDPSWYAKWLRKRIDGCITRHAAEAEADDV